MGFLYAPIISFDDLIRTTWRLPSEHHSTPQGSPFVVVSTDRQPFFVCLLTTTNAMDQSLKVVTGFTLVPVESKSASELISDKLASVKPLVIRWLLAKAPLHSRVAGESFSRLQVFAAYIGVALFILLLGIVESI